MFHDIHQVEDTLKELSELSKLQQSEPASAFQRRAAALVQNLSDNADAFSTLLMGPAVVHLRVALVEAFQDEALAGLRNRLLDTDAHQWMKEITATYQQDAAAALIRSEHPALAHPSFTTAVDMMWLHVDSTTEPGQREWAFDRILDNQRTINHYFPNDARLTFQHLAKAAKVILAPRTAARLFIAMDSEVRQASFRQRSTADLLELTSDRSELTAPDKRAATAVRIKRAEQTAESAFRFATEQLPVLRRTKASHEIDTAINIMKNSLKADPQALFASLEPAGRAAEREKLRRAFVAEPELAESVLYADGLATIELLEHTASTDRVALDLQALNINAARLKWTTPDRHLTDETVAKADIILQDLATPHRRLNQKTIDLLAQTFQADEAFAAAVRHAGRADLIGAVQDASTPLNAPVLER